uniref:Uncharacterized protein n=1 Tax=Arundo donax TaxID=35708 RepID=A0A0A9U9Z8_ARUDO
MVQPRQGLLPTLRHDVDGRRAEGGGGARE